MRDAVIEAVEAHREMKLARIHRDRAIRRAKQQDGLSAYAIAKRFREELGERGALTAARVGQIIEAGNRGGAGCEPAPRNQGD